MSSTLLPRDVRKALALMNADPARERTLGELAAACRVAPRTLQKHFHQYVGYPPRAVLRDLRLDLVRRELLRGGADLNVTELATRCGFTHLGRFAGWYRRRYGESPSTTLRRERRNLAPYGPSSGALPLAIDRPIIAVMPFRAVGAALGPAADLADELTLALGRLRWVAVGMPHAARYQVRGSVRANAVGRLRSTVTLFDAVSGRCLWADAWENELEDALAFQERVANSISTKLQTPLRNAEIERACRKEPEQLRAWQLTMRALSRAMIVEPASQSEALELAEQAIELAPLDPLPLGVAAWCHGMRAGHHFTGQPEVERHAARELASRAAQLRVRDPTAEALLASAYTLAHDLERAGLHVDHALALDGGCAWAWQRSGWLKVYAGEAAEAIERFQIARSLDPADPLAFLASIGIAAANFERASYREAIFWFERGIAESPRAVWANRFLAPAYALSGRREDARASFAALMRGDPNWTIAQVRSSLPHTDGFADRAATGLESLGMRLS